MIFIGILMYFGALIIPAAYLFSTRWRGAAKRPMLIGVGLQLFWSLAVWAFVYLSARAGYTDAYYGCSTLSTGLFLILLDYQADEQTISSQSNAA